MTDELTRAIENISGDLPKPRLNLSEEEKNEIVEKLGPRTVRDIVKAMKEFSKARIPFLFSSIDTQAIVDILANDFAAAIQRALKK